MGGICRLQREVWEAYTHTLRYTQQGGYLHPEVYRTGRHVHREVYTTQGGMYTGRYTSQGSYTRVLFPSSYLGEAIPGFTVGLGPCLPIITRFTVGLRRGLLLITRFTVGLGKRPISPYSRFTVGLGKKPVSP